MQHLLCTDTIPNRLRLVEQRLLGQALVRIRLWRKTVQGATVLTATINNTGAYTVTLNKAISHPIARLNTRNSRGCGQHCSESKADDNNPSTAAAVADLTVNSKMTCLLLHKDSERCI